MSFKKITNKKKKNRFLEQSSFQPACAGNSQGSTNLDSDELKYVGTLTPKPNVTKPIKILFE